MALTIGRLSLQKLNALLDTPNILQEVEVLQGFRQFQDDPDNSNSLPGEQRAKIDLAASEIIQTLDQNQPLPTVGVVVIGHADQDLTKFGAARTQFELDISRRRAKLVTRVLFRTLNSLMLLSQDSVASLRFSLIQFRQLGRGATELLFPPRADRPLTEFERSMNRRVQILAVRDFPSIRVLIMLCIHGGQVLSSLLPIPLESDEFPVVGCPFFSSKTLSPSPCVKARFSGKPDTLITPDSVGSTFNEEGTRQGPVVIG